MAISRNEQFAVECFMDREDGLTTDELARAIGVPWNTANPIRFALWQRGLILATGHKRMTRSGKPATVYVFANRRSAIPKTEPVTLSHEDKVEAREALYEMVIRDKEMGLSIPPAVIRLGQWLDAKVLLGDRREQERGGDEDR
jgi:hypothetical protein